MTPRRKRLAMLRLEEALAATQAAFNAKLFALRDVKRKVLADVAAKLDGLAGLARAAAGGSEPEALARAAAFLAPFAGLPPGLALVAEEEPAAAREAVSAADLAAFAARRQEEQRRAAAVAAGGLGGFAASAAPPAQGAAGARKAAAAAATAAASGGAAGGGARPGAASLSAGEEALARVMAAVPPSELEKGLSAVARRRVEHLRSKLSGAVMEGGERSARSGRRSGAT